MQKRSGRNAKNKLCRSFFDSRFGRKFGGVRPDAPMYVLYISTKQPTGQ